MKNMKRAMKITLACIAVALTGCASYTPDAQQKLFNGKYRNVSNLLDQKGCNIHKMEDCDYKETVIDFATNGLTGEVRLVQGPEAIWEDTDKKNNLYISVARQDSMPLITLWRIGVEADCINSIQAEGDKVSTMTIPACGKYSEIQANWKVVSSFGRSTELLKERMGLIFQSLIGGEVP